MTDMLSEIWATVRRNKMRTALTGFAVAWGIFIIIFLLGAGNGLINSMENNNRRFVDNSMQVFGGTTSKPYKGLKEGRDIQLNDRDAEMTRRNFTGNVSATSSIITYGNMTVSMGKNSVSANISGVEPISGEIRKVEMLHGRFINKIDVDERRRVLVLSDTQAKELSGNDISSVVGKGVKMGGFSYGVVGIYKDRQDGMNNNAFAPFSTIRTIYADGDKVGSIEFTFGGLETEEENKAFEDRYRRAVGTNHDIAPDDEDGIWIWNRFTQAMQMATATGMIRTALWIIGLFTLLSGIVGVSNIMLITVKERTKEFGIRKAIGATPMSILRLVIVESVIITSIFGYVGMVAGIAANQYMDATIGNTKVNTGLFEATMFVDPTVGIDVCIQATLVIITCGTIAGALPARKAAKTKPIEALRAE